jgi:MFS family permease
MLTCEPALEAPPRPLWRNRDYLLLWSGQAVSTLGSQLSLFAFPLLMLALTRSPAQAGFLGAARTLPFLLLGLPAGAVVDRVNRKRLMIACDLGRALVLGSIPVAMALGSLPLVQLYAVALLEGTLNVFFNLANTAALTRVVPRPQLATATAVDEVTLSSGFMLGPALGGIAYAASAALPFLVDAVSYVASVATLRLIRSELHVERSAVGVTRLRAAIREGLVWLWHQPLLRFLALLVGGGLFVEGGYTLAVIVLAQHMGASSEVIGLILSAGGAGSVAGAMLAAPLTRRLTFRQLTLGVHWIWAAALPLYTVAGSPLALCAISTVTFGITPIFLVTQFSYRLALIPDELQGRVNSLFRMLLFGGQPLGLALAGVLTQALGPAAAILVLATLLALLALAATLNPHLRGAAGM